MIVVKGRPPLWDLIDKTFHVAGLPILFAWGDRIFNPEGVSVPRELHAHEEIHGERQLGYVADSENLIPPVENWWHKYIAEPAFRLAEEIPAHKAEYLSFCKRHGSADTRKKMLGYIAQKLASPLYGNLLTVSQARERVLVGV